MNYAQGFQIAQMNAHMENEASWTWEPIEVKIVQLSLAPHWMRHLPGIDWFIAEWTHRK